MTTRTITLTLTEAQFRALAGAVATYQTELEDESNDGMPGWHGRMTALLNAWAKVNGAWHRTAQ